jgi:hypothetical protein
LDWQHSLSVALPCKELAIDCQEEELEKMIKIPNGLVVPLDSGNPVQAFLLTSSSKCSTQLCYFVLTPILALF